MSNALFNTAFQLLDAIAVAVKTNNFQQAESNYTMLVLAVGNKQLKFDPKGGYNMYLFNDWMQLLHTNIVSKNAEEACEAQSAVYYMLDEAYY